MSRTLLVRALALFISNTITFRSSLPEDHTLFLTYLNTQAKQKTPTSIRPGAVANWVKYHMVRAGVKESYSAHSIRAASSTTAVELGNSVDKVKSYANWSLNSNTFERYYFKPPRQDHDCINIQNSIFCTENNTTSESEAEATSIVLGTTYNTEVVQTQPWYRRIFN